ncbi:MAG: hypothetical protein KJ804_02775, partial [Proteobacteria bacterium]|nr:hypothetical protein [Pseudomonadota bacterium]
WHYKRPRNVMSLMLRVFCFASQVTHSIPEEFGNDWQKVGLGALFVAAEVSTIYIVNDEPLIVQWLPAG